MKVLFNATTLVMGGALQVAVAFIKQSLIDNEIEWCYALSKEVLFELTDADRSMLGTECEVFDVSPSRSVEQRKRLKSLEESFSVDVVFTLFGPAYTVFTKPHVCGVADGWVTHSSFLAFKSLGSLSNVLSMLITIFYKAIWYRRSLVWIVEANNAKNGLIKRLFLKPSSIYVIKNTCGRHYFNMNLSPPDFSKLKKIRILCMSAYYPHKNLDIIPEILAHLCHEIKDIEFEAVLTLPLDSVGYKEILKKAKHLGVDKYICNLGHVKINDGPSVYEQCHIVFLPSLLETSSANYPEAMAANRPIITTDLSHAHDACKNSAQYYEPKNAKSAARQIINLINDPELLAEIIRNGKEILKFLPTPRQRFQQYVRVIKSVVR